MADNRGRKGGRVTQRATPPARAGGRPSPATKGRGSSASAPATRAPAEPAPARAGGFAAGVRALLDPAGAGAGRGADERERPWWGLGDVLVWFLVAQVATVIVYTLVLAAGGYALAYPTGPGAVVGEYTGQVAVGLTPEITRTAADLPLAVTALLQVPLWLGLLGGPLYAARRKGTSLKVDFGFEARWRDVPTGLAIGVGAQLLLLPALYWLLFRLLGEEYDVSARARELTDQATGPGGVVLLILIVGVGAPVFEELFFRGLTQRALANRLGPVAAVALSSVFFASAHVELIEFLGLLAFGVILGVLAQRTGRLGPSIFAHMGFNLTAAVTLLWNLPLP